MKTQLKVRYKVIGDDGPNDDSIEAVKETFGDDVPVKIIEE